MKAGDYERGEREGNRIYMTGKLTERNLSGEKKGASKARRVGSKVGCM